MRRRRDGRWGDGLAGASLQLHSPGDGAGPAPAGWVRHSRAQGGPRPFCSSPVLFSSHVLLHEGGDSHEHPSSWALGMGHPAMVTSHCHRAQLPCGQRCIPDPGQTHLLPRAVLAHMAGRASSLRGFLGITWGSGSAQGVFWQRCPPAPSCVWSSCPLPVPCAVSLGSAAGAGSGWSVRNADR